MKPIQKEARIAPDRRVAARIYLDVSEVEDDGLGDELTVLWEVEPGRTILERRTLPDPSQGRFDDPGTLHAFLNALRRGAITNAETDALQAPFRAGIAIEDYQLDPLVRSLRMPRVHLLVADDVGLGKTIEAGLVVQELILQHRARRVLVVCPAPLTNKCDAQRGNDGRRCGAHRNGRRCA